MFRPPRIQKWTQQRASHSHCKRPALLHFFRSSSRLSLSSIFLLTSFFSGCTAQDAFFCPQDGCADRLIEEVRAATKSVHVAIAYFNHDAIADVLIEAQERGIEVMVVGEQDENHAAYTNSEGNQVKEGINYDVVTKLKKAGIPYRDDSNSAIMHNKFSVIDGHTVLTGSFNYTNAADTANNENLVILTSDRMAAAFEAEFQDLWANGVE